MKKILISVVSITLCLTTILCSTLFVSAEDNVRVIDYDYYDDAFYTVLQYDEYSASYSRPKFYNILGWLGFPHSDNDGTMWLNYTMPQYQTTLGNNSTLTRSPYVPYIIVPNVRNSNGQKLSNNFGTRLTFGKNSAYWQTDPVSKYLNYSCFTAPKDYTVHYRINFFLPSIHSVENFSSTYIGLRFYYSDTEYVSSFPVVDFTELVYFDHPQGSSVGPYEGTNFAPSQVNNVAFVSVVGSATFKQRVKVKYISLQLRDVPNFNTTNGIVLDRPMLFVKYESGGFWSEIDNTLSNIKDTITNFFDSINSFLSSVWNVVEVGFNAIVDFFANFGRLFSLQGS